MAEAGTHIVRVALQDEPTIYREIESRKTLSDLAEAIVHAFSFELDHAFGFYSKLTGRNVMRSQPKYELFADMGEETSARSVRKTPVSEAFPGVGHTLLFMFDYGDDWCFVVKVIGLGQKVAKTLTRRCSRRSARLRAIWRVGRGRGALILFQKIVTNILGRDASRRLFASMVGRCFCGSSLHTLIGSSFRLGRL
jgi:hypothetical protein